MTARRTDDEPLNLGFFLQTDMNWIGGVYYVLNIVRAIQESRRRDDLRLFLIYPSRPSKEIDSLLGELVATHINLSSISLTQKLLVRAKGLYSPYNLLQHVCKTRKIRFLYPLLSFHPSHAIKNTTVAHWIPDFQHKFLPELFSNEELQKRDSNYHEIATKGEILFLSSQNALDHFNRFYPQATVKTRLLRFKSLVSPLDLAPIDDAEIISQGRPFFMVCNQFWAHKNHDIVLRAAVILRETKNSTPLILFTGKTHDPRNSDYSTRLEEYIKSNDLRDSCKFLGLVDRGLQLRLMKQCQRVIQPSKFEGWSTVIEDAKALGKRVLASNLDVHYEQLGEKADYFDINDAQSLADLMESALESEDELSTIQSQEDRRSYGEELVNLFRSCAE